MKIKYLLCPSADSTPNLKEMNPNIAMNQDPILRKAMDKWGHMSKILLFTKRMQQEKRF
ncbi:hypothetical protein ACORE2_29535 (plasmid) [Bacillus thuringiensis]|uniref:hypothetical protein n=1 Tax=Bacillus thuringiensis TaxID=1428 RepID=UPI003BAFE810